MVGAEGFEPPTFCSQSRRATRLRYAPNLKFLGKILKQYVNFSCGLGQSFLLILRTNTMETLKNIIDIAFEQVHEITPNQVDKQLKDTVWEVIELLDTGKVRVAEPLLEGGWKIHAWLKKAILLFFRITQNSVIEGAFTQFFDKVPLKYEGWSQEHFNTQDARVVPPACVRKGAFIAPHAILMPSYINIGAYVGSGSMVDTWATVGSCAQIGENVHLSGGVGIGGVLEPLQANPTIIEDDCFIGARSEIVEGVIVEKGAVISMGVYIGQSTRIYDRTTGETFYGRVPKGSVVVPGSLPSKTGECHLYAAIIVKRVDESTRKKVSINDILRDA